MVAILGMVLLVAGTAGFCMFDETTPLVIVALVNCARMFGMTISINPLTAYCVGGLKGAEVSHGNAIVASMRQMFSSILSKNRGTANSVRQKYDSQGEVSQHRLVDFLFYVNVVSVIFFDQGHSVSFAAYRSPDCSLLMCISNSVKRVSSSTNCRISSSPNSLTKDFHISI